MSVLRFKFILFTCATLIGKCYSTNDGDCIINDDDINWANNIYTHPKIKDTEKVHKVFQFEDDLVLDATNPGPNGKFIEVRVDSEQKQLIFETNGDFDNFDESVPKQSARTVTMVTTAHLQCSAGKTILRFSVEVEDTNNHDPTFGKSSYTYNMPMPLIPRIDLTSLGDEIIATDVDFSNQKVEFTIDPPGTFELTTISSAKSKDYRAVLKVTEFTWLTKETTYTITATDSGNPPRKSTSSLIITLDETNILQDIPKFSASYYRFKYTVDDKGNPTLTPSTSDPIFITVTDPEAMSVKLQGSDYFTANFDPKTKQVTIGVTDKTIDVTSEHVIVLTLTATLNNNQDESSEATILVDIPKENVVGVLIFTKPYYTATYSSSHTVALDDGQEIGVKQNADNVKIKLTGDPDHFTLSKTGNQWQLSVNEKLDDETLRNGRYIVLTLTATVTGEGSTDVHPGYAALIVKLPEVARIECLRFSKTYYTATYIVNKDGKDSVKLDNPISASSSRSKSVTIALGDQSENFEITPEADSWIVSVTNKLSDYDLKAGGEIVLGLVAIAVVEDTEDVETGYATLIIKLPEITPIEVPRFFKTYYTN